MCFYVMSTVLGARGCLSRAHVSICCDSGLRNITCQFNTKIALFKQSNFCMRTVAHIVWRMHCHSPIDVSARLDFGRCIWDLILETYFIGGWSLFSQVSVLGEQWELLCPAELCACTWLLEPEWPAEGFYTKLLINFVICGTDVFSGLCRKGYSGKIDNRDCLLKDFDFPCELFNWQHFWICHENKGVRFSVWNVCSVWLFLKRSSERSNIQFPINRIL